MAFLWARSAGSRLGCPSFFGAAADTLRRMPNVRGRASPSRPSDSILFATIALMMGLAFAFVTPPFREPDELFHLFRSAAMANGHLIPSGGPDTAPIPHGLLNFAFVMSLTDEAGKFRSDQFRQAIRIPLERSDLRVVSFPAWYTPIPFLPQALTVLAAQVLSARPIAIFYAGRVINLLVSLAMVTAAMRLAPSLRPVIAAVALLPMSLFQFASWSPDALTIAACILLTAALLGAVERTEPIAAREVILICAIALIAGLCKPAYFLIALLVVAIPRERFRSARHRLVTIAAVIGAMAVATAISFGYAQAAFYQQRGGLPIDPASQLRCIAADPVRFVQVLLHDAATNGWSYAQQTVGRLGVGEIKLPVAVIVVELALLVVVGMSVRTHTPRLIALSIVVVTAVGVVISQYLTWSIICGDVIEGVQGRYFLPVLPLAVAAIWSAAAMPPPLPRFAKSGAATVVQSLCNAVALMTIIRSYW